MNIRIIGDESAFSRFLKGNGISYIILFAVFITGVIAGSLYYKNVGDAKKLSTYLEETIEKINNSSKANSSFIVKGSLVKNIGISILFWLLGASIIGIIFLLIYIMYKGFTLGFTISTFISTFGFLRGNIISFTMLFFQNIFFVLAMIIAACSGIKLAINIMSKRKDVKIELIRHTIVCIFCTIFFLFSSIIEFVFNGLVLEFILKKI